MLLQSFCSLTVNASPFYPQSTDIRTICREFEHVIKYVVFGFPTKNHPQTSVLKLEKPSENNRSQWLSKNNRTDCDGKNVLKPSTSHCCYKKKHRYRIAIKNSPSLKSKADSSLCLPRTFDGSSLCCCSRIEEVNSLLCRSPGQSQLKPHSSQQQHEEKMRKKQRGKSLCSKKMKRKKIRGRPPHPSPHLIASQIQFFWTTSKFSRYT